MKTFYFNTGVRPEGHNPPIRLSAGHVWKNGTMQVPFDCEGVPDGWYYAFSCDNPNLLESKTHHVAEMHNTAMVSKYAYFRGPLKIE